MFSCMLTAFCRATYLLLISSFLTTLSAAQQQNADTIFINGDIYPGVPATREKVAEAKPLPRAQALAVREDRIVAVGTNAEIRRYRGPRTQSIDLRGKFVMPGFNDAHTHVASGGFEKLHVNLSGTRSLDEMKKRIAERATSAAKDEWIIGRGWDHTKWTEQRLPSRRDLDEVTAGRPAFFTRVDGHIAVANTAALEAAGITRETRDPEGGRSDRDESGEATGILRESAKDLVTRKIPPPTPSQRRRAIELALEEAARWGITSAQDNSSWEDFLVYEDLQREGKLTLRITEWLPFRAPVQQLQQRRAHHREGDLMLRTGLLKAVLDGTLGSHTAAMLAPYSDDPNNTGLPQYSQDQLNQMARERIEAGFQFGFHAIGDRAAEMALDACEEAQRHARERMAHTPAGTQSQSRSFDFRHRVEHAQVLTGDHAARFAELGVIASMQPNHLLTDMNWAESRLGRSRAQHSYPWAELLKAGVRLAFGTDYPVEPITPFRGLYAAVTRKDEEGKKEYVPQQKISIHAAIRAYTSDAAYAELSEQDKGTLQPGKLADFVVLDRDVTKAAPEEILKAKVLRTVVGSRTVYQSE
jgi:predicted amidohydrolase YtcJ